MKNLTRCLTAMTIGWCWMSLVPLASANTATSTSLAELEFSNSSGDKSSALLLDTEVSGEITGLIATITIRQNFRNTSDDWVHGEYRFPLPETAAVDSLELETDGRILHGVVKEKEKAEREFKAAKTEGKKAGLLRQHRPNLFSMALANIAPQAEVTATLSFVTTVDFDYGRFSLRLPTTLTPRYIAGNPLPYIDGDESFEQSGSVTVSSEHGWGFATDQVADAPDVTPFQIPGSQQVDSHRFTLNLKLNSGLPLSQVISNTHALDIQEQGDGTRLVTLSAGAALLDRDLVIEWVPQPNDAPEAAVFQQVTDKGHHNLVMLMPPTKNIVSTLPREIIFIVDSSGSMAGLSMMQAQQGLQSALNLLSPADHFNVIEFDSSSTALFPQSVKATPDVIAHAANFVNNMIADGGTNMEQALEMAFSMEAEQSALRQIVFITDGSVGNEQYLFEMINRNLRDSRLFTVGIGSAPNAHFMRGAARFGRGSYHYVDDISSTAVAMRQLFERLNRPVMRNITLQLPGNSDAQVEPGMVPDLYLGQPLMATIKTSKPLQHIEIGGELAGQSWQRSLAASNAPHAMNIDKIWARHRVESLESELVTGLKSASKVKQEIIQTGLENQIVTRFTSFIAVEEKITRPQEEQSKNTNVPNLMPKGNAMPIPVPATGTAANLLAVSGLLLSMLSIVGLRRSRKTA